MPLEEIQRKLIADYCIRDLPGDLLWHIKQFSFIQDEELRRRLGRAYYASRYMAKLMEALRPEDDTAHPFIKFQIIQYASIYEAVTSYLLWNKFKEHEEVVKLQLHKAYKPVSALSSSASIKFEDEEIVTCVYRDTKTPKNSIPFKDKVDCAQRIGFIDASYAEDLKETYNLRNLAHIESEASRLIELELEQAKTAYRRIKPFLEKINSFFSELNPADTAPLIAEET